MNSGLHSVPRPPLRRRVSRGLERLLYWSGAGSVYLKVARVRGALILMYHSVCSEADAGRWIDPANCVAAARFEAQMAFLARHRQVLAMGELVDQLEQGRTPPAGTVVITFDDGYRDTLQAAAPVLTRHGLPATVYLATGYVERGESQWIDQLWASFAGRTRQTLQLPEPDARSWDLASAARAGEAYRAVAGRLLVASWAERRALLSEIRAQLSPQGDPPRLTLSWDEVRTLAREHPGFEVGVHTRDHLDLVQHGPETAQREIDACVADVESALGRAPEHFSFPYGRANVELSRRVAKAGLRSAVVTEPAALIHGSSERFALARVEAPLDPTRFRFWTSGAGPDLPHALGRTS